MGPQPGFSSLKPLNFTEVTRPKVRAGYKTPKTQHPWDLKRLWQAPDAPASSKSHRKGLRFEQRGWMAGATAPEGAAALPGEAGVGPRAGGGEEAPAVLAGLPGALWPRRPPERRPRSAAHSRPASSPRTEPPPRQRSLTRPWSSAQAEGPATRLPDPGPGAWEPSPRAPPPAGTHGSIAPPRGPRRPAPEPARGRTAAAGAVAGTTAARAARESPQRCRPRSRARKMPARRWAGPDASGSVGTRAGGGAVGGLGRGRECWQGLGDTRAGLLLTPWD